MTFYVVDLDETWHRCPVDPDGHPWHTTRTIAAVIDGGPCRTPVTITCGDTTTTIECGRVLPAPRQCGSCRIVVTQHAITRTPPTEQVHG